MQAIKKIKRRIWWQISILAAGIAFFVFTGSAARAAENLVFREGLFNIGNISALSSASTEIVSQDLTAEFEFNSFGLSWQEKDAEAGAAKIYVKILDNKGWSEWREINPLDETTIQEPGDGRPYFSDLFFASAGRSIRYKVVFPDGRGAIGDLKIFYFNAFNTFNDFKMSVSGLNDAELNIIPRVQWISEEVAPLDRKESWPEAYQQPEKIIIHHTGTVLKDVNKDGVVSQPDYLLTAQAIYRWQAKVLDGGWRDVGYNFLIDPDGNIYEGRYGRDGVIAGHTIRSAQCDLQKFGHSGQIVGFNRGTIGIALLGDFETESPTTVALNSLINLVAFKGLEFDLEPNGSSFFVDLNLPNVIGHRDVDCTLCPGGNLYLNLPYVRQQAQQKYLELRNKLIAQGIRPQARLIYQSDQAIDLKAGETKEIWADFKNEGNTAWHNYTIDAVYLADVGIKSDLASLDSYALATIDETLPKEKLVKPKLINFPYLAAKLVQPNVKPGEVGTFKFTISEPSAGSGTKNYVLTWGDKGWFSNTDFSLAVNSAETDYTTQLFARQSPPAYFIGGVASLGVTFKNVGSQPWPTDKIVLNISGEDGKVSLFRHSGWSGDFGRIAPKELAEKTQINPGETVMFIFNLKNPAKPGLYKNVFKLEFSDNRSNISGGRYEMPIQVDAPLAAEIVGHNIPAAVMSAWRPEVYLRVKNVGNIPWGRTFTLESYDEKGGQSLFSHPEWQSKTRIDKLENEVKPGETVTFTFQLKPPVKAGTYQQTFVLKMDGEKVFINGDYSFSLLTRVDDAASVKADAQAKAAVAQEAATKTVAAKTTTAKTTAPKIITRTHTVKSGENLTYIAKKYGVTIAKILSANKLKNANKILIGQKLIIPN